ncbi:MAG: hypothetical protein ACOC1U_10520, partial [Spirochaetota bacterium]
RPLYESAITLHREFPANRTIRTIAVYATVRAGFPGEALELAAGELGRASPVVYAWTLLSNADRAAPRAADDSRAAPSDDGGAADEMILVGLDSRSDATSFERAWRLTGDPRYALDGALLFAHEGAVGQARELSTHAGLEHRWPLLHAGLLADTGRFEAMVSLLERQNDLGERSKLMLADAYLRTGRDADALELYGSLLRADSPPAIAYVNTAALTHERSPRDARAVIDAGRLAHPDAYSIARAEAIIAARGGRGEQPDVSLDAWFESEHAADARLLSLRLSADPDTRHYRGELWRLIERHPTDDVLRYAAWYFASRDALDDLEVVLGAWNREAPAWNREAPAWNREAPAWVSFYRAHVSAQTGEWAEAAAGYERSFVTSPTWQAAHNAAIARYRMADQPGGDGRVQDAVLLARNTSGPDRVRALLLGARASRDAATQRRFVEEALSIEPASTEALLLRTQLDNPSSR